MKPDEAPFDLFVEIPRHEQLSAALQRLLLAFTLPVKADLILLHLRSQLLDRNGSVSVAVHLLKEEADLFLGHFGVDVPQELCELVEAQFLALLEPQAL